MKDRKINREEFASRIGVSLSALGHWFTGRNDPGLLNIEKMAYELHVTPEFLIYGVEPQNQQPVIDDKLLRECISAVFDHILDGDEKLSVNTLSEYIVELYEDPGDLKKPNKIKRFIKMLGFKNKK